MEELKIDTITLPDTIPAEEKVLKSEKIDNLSQEKLKTLPDKTSDDSKKDNQTEKVIETRINKEVNEKLLKNEVKKNQSQPDTVVDKPDLLEPPESDAMKHSKKISDSVPCCPSENKEKIIKNQSDIFSLKNIAPTLQTHIFSVNGCPSRRVFRKQEPAGHVFQKNEAPPAESTSTTRGDRITRENYNDEKRPSSSYRNPLTGTGLSSNDEYKSKGTKRKDGNPLLGLGYDEVAKVTSQHRIPPGGYSHKLW